MPRVLLALTFASVMVWSCGGSAGEPTPSPTTSATPTPTATQEPTPTRKPTPSPTPSVGTRENPAPLGVWCFSDGWCITTIGYTLDEPANEVVALANRFNDPPAPGHEFSMAWVVVKYVGEGSASFSDSLSLKAVGASNVGYTQYGNSCGALGNLRLPSADVFPGGEISGFVCWEIQSEDADSLLMYYEPLSIFSDNKFFFSLDVPAGP